MNEHKFMIYLGLTLVGLGVLLDTPLSFPLVLVGNLFIIFYSIMDRKDLEIKCKQGESLL